MSIQTLQYDLKVENSVTNFKHTYLLKIEASCKTLIHGSKVKKCKQNTKGLMQPPRTFCNIGNFTWVFITGKIIRGEGIIKDSYFTCRLNKIILEHVIRNK